MIRGWEGFRRWALKCVGWMPIFRHWQREQEDIGRRNMELIERREADLMGELLLSGVDMSKLTAESVTADRFFPPAQAGVVRAKSAEFYTDEHGALRAREVGPKVTDE